MSCDPSDPRTGSSSSRLLDLAPWLLIPLAVAIRALPWPSVFPLGGGVLPFGNDAYYHLRRIAYSVHNFPAFLGSDPYVNFPDGGQPIWTPVLDWLLAGLAVVGVGSGDALAMERLLVWVPPLVGAATVAVLYRMARHHFEGPVAPAAGLLLCVLPAHFWYSQLGFIDHHVVVAFVTTLLLAAGMALLHTDVANSRLGARASWGAIGLGGAVAASLLVWPGCLLHVGVVQVALGIRVVTSPGESGVRWARLSALVHGVACVLVLPLCLGNEWVHWGRFSPVVLSHFQPLWLGGAALGFAMLAEIWRRAPGRFEGGLRFASALTLAAILAGLSLAASPDLFSGVGDIARWFFRAEAFQANVGESIPLLARGSDRAQEVFSRLFFATPLMLIFAARLAQRSASPASLWLFTGWCAALFVATLTQRRFMNSFAVAYALLVAWVLFESVRFTAARLGNRRHRLLAVAASAMVGLWALQPVAESYFPYLRNLARHARGERPKPHFVGRLQMIRVVVADWLSRNSPETSGYLDVEETPEYSVLAPWSSGHVLKYVARRPVVQDNFGDDVAPGNWALAKRFYGVTDEGEALEIAKEFRARYVLSRLEDSNQLNSYDLSSMYVRLSVHRGSGRLGRRGQGAEPVRVAALSRLRLIYESVPLMGEPSLAPSLFKLYEIVPGARVWGRAAPEAEVEARLDVQPDRATSFEYQVRAHADETGRWELRLPYSNERFSSAVSVGPAYRLKSGDVESELAIQESSVMEGERLEGPDLRG